MTLSSDCRRMLTERFILNLRARGFVQVSCTDDKSTTFPSLSNRSSQQHFDVTASSTVIHAPVGLFSTDRLTGISKLCACAFDGLRIHQPGSSIKYR